MWRKTTVAVSVLLATAACGSTGEPPQNDDKVDEVTVGVIAIVDVAPIYLGKEKGFFSDRNIDLTMEVGSGGAASVPGVTSGKFQFAFANVTSLLVARDQGLPLKAVANGVSSTGEPGNDFGAIVVRDDSPMRDAADLEGKLVSANNVNNICDTTIRATVRNAGGDPTKLEWTEVDFPDASAAVQSGRIDAACVVEPFVTQAISEGNRVLASMYAESTEDLPVALYFTTEQTMAQDPDLVKRFTAAINESLTYANSHPDEVRKIVGTYAPIPEQIKQDMILPKWPTDINRDAVEDIGNFAHEDGLLENPPDVDGLLE